VDRILGNNICPNCGGGLMPRPIRPSKSWKDGNYLDNDPASTKVKYKPVDLEAYAELVAAINSLPPEER